TITQVAEMMLEQGAKSVRAIATHPVLSGPAYERIDNSCLEEVVVTDSIPLKQKSDKIRVLGIANLFADVIRKVYNHQSISTVFQKIRN
ncbi:MAG: ribose-phosphate pyrophosphokinase, partial [Bacteroidales bacterium]